jgi:hypothetical protein
LHSGGRMHASALSQHLTRVGCCVVVTLVCAGVLGTGCLPADDCHVGAVRCQGDELQRCTAHPAGVFGPPDDPTYVHGSAPTWDKEADCGMGLCIRPANGTDAFCALEAAPLDACAGVDAACEGSALVYCNDGYPVEHEVCLACSAGPECLGVEGMLDPRCCQGGPLADCTSDAACAPSLRCNGGRCELPCACAEGAACDACAAGHAVAPDGGVTVMHTCSNGFCVE